jgi:hypothetical protein
MFVKTQRVNCSDILLEKFQIAANIIGKVPDRGGRTMPSWQKRQPDRGEFNQAYRGNRSGGFQQNQGYLQHQYQQKAPYNPANQDYNQAEGSGNRYFRERDGRVQGNWNQRGQSYDNQHRDN